MYGETDFLTVSIYNCNIIHFYSMLSALYCQFVEYYYYNYSANSVNEGDKASSYAVPVDYYQNLGYMNM